MVAVNVTSWPKTDGVPDEWTAVVVAIGPLVETVTGWLTRQIRRPRRPRSPRQGWATGAVASCGSGAESGRSWLIWLAVVVLIVVEVVVIIGARRGPAVTEQEGRVLAGIGRGLEQSD